MLGSLRAEAPADANLMDARLIDDSDYLISLFFMTPRF